MKTAYTFDDVLIEPKFSNISSRKDVDISVNFLGQTLYNPVISSNMDTVTGPEMAIVMLNNGAQACLHRFYSIEDNVKAFKESVLYSDTVNDFIQPFASIGLGGYELDRAKALYDAGASIFVIDVAHGAQLSVAQQANKLREIVGSQSKIVVGNFASALSLKTFLEYANNVDAIKIGVGPGSVCKTRIVTGCGMPQLSAIKEISVLLKNTDIQIIADGGMRTSGDICKALAAGAHTVMLGGMLAGTSETPGEKAWKNRFDHYLTEDVALPKKTNLDGTLSIIKDAEIELPCFKKYRGSASKESYEDQGKSSSWRTEEGEAIYVPYKGPVKNILQQIEGGLRSSMTYVGARNLKEYRENAEFVLVTQAGMVESHPHGKK